MPGRIEDARGRELGTTLEESESIGDGTGHGDQSLSWAETVRPLTESKTTGVFGTA